MADTLSHIVKAVRRFPPLLAIQRARYRRGFPHWLGAFHGVYGSFAEALAAAPSDRPTGYDAKGPAGMYEDRLSRVFPSDYPVLFWLDRLLQPNQHMVDFGGHVGIAFYAYQRYLTYPEGFRYTVVDVPAVVERGRELAQERGEARIGFTADPESVGPFDLLLASGSTQYLEPADPLATLGATGQLPEHVLLHRIPVHPRHGFVTLQNIGTAFCPYRIYRRDAVLHGIDERGYEIVDEWENLEHRCVFPLDSEHSVPSYTGFYLRRRH